MAKHFWKIDRGRAGYTGFTVLWGIFQGGSGLAGWHCWASPFLLLTYDPWPEGPRTVRGKLSWRFHYIPYKD